ncbi:MAG TPA: hypothetical protein VFV34_02410 [Blastocatellia bacterium]|nr:hypothetical protein [Blastocatellia bacterium]
MRESNKSNVYSRKLARFWTPYTEPFLLFAGVLILSFLLLNLLIFTRVLTDEKDVMTFGEITGSVALFAWPIKLLVVFCVRAIREGGDEGRR